MKKRIFNAILLVLIAVLLFSGVTASAYESYETYTYSIDGEPLKSPTAYSAETVVNSAKMGLTTKLQEANDIVADHLGNIYIADKANNRIVVLDAEQYVVIAEISSYLDENNQPQTLNSPTGLFVTDPTITVGGESYIYICDSGNKRIVIFDREYNYVKTIVKPDSELISERAFVPYAIAVDIYGRIFVVSRTCYEGVIVLSSDGEFTGFIGAQKLVSSFFELIWRNFMTEEQKENTEQTTTTAFNNITVDKDGFVYVTISFNSTDDKKQQVASLKSKDATYSPVKKLNSTGAEIMKRNGFFDPGGEVGIFYPEEASNIVDVALGAEGAWTILDNLKIHGESRSRLFTYDNNGNLLYAFGNSGEQLGNGENLVALTYQVVNGVYKIVVLDNAVGNYKITVYSPTEYCDTITAALKNQNEHKYATSIDYWQDVLTRNNNFDLAYIGIGKALFNQGKYEEAMEMLKGAYETDYYSKAFAEIRKDVISKWLLPLLIAVIALIVLSLKFLGYAKRVNKATALVVGRKTYWQELLYAFHLVFHPFDGYWDLKHEPRGSVRAGSTILGITVLAFFYQAIGQGYIFSPRENYSSVFVQMVSVVIPFGLWVVANWCLTTLFDGEGSFKDVYIATCYSLAPLPIFIVISTVLTNVLTVTEGTIPSLLVTIGYVWVGILLFFGTLVTHDYSMGKNIITVLGTIVAMAIIMFIAILFSSLVVKMVTFLISLFTEIGNRL